MECSLWTFLAQVSHHNLILFWIFAGTSFQSLVLHLYLVNAFITKEIPEIPRYHIVLNVLQLLIVGIVVVECVGDTLCPLV